MKLGRVVGTVVSTINHPDFDDRTLLLCDLLDPAGRTSGGSVIAVDSVGAGAGEIVLLLDEGNSARQVLGAPGAPIRTVVVGIVDAVSEGPPPAASPAVVPGAAAGPRRPAGGPRPRGPTRRSAPGSPASRRVARRRS
jgi:ethanolamine utilization protein EutN